MSIETLAKEMFGDKITDEQLASLVEASTEDTDAAVAGLKTNQAKNLDQIAKLKSNQVPDGFDQDAFDTFLKEKDDFAQKQKELDEKKLEDEGQWVALKDKMAASHKAALDTLNSENSAEISALRTALDKELIENSLNKAIDKEKGNAFFLMPHLKSQVKTVSVDGQFETHVVDAKGEQRITDEGKAFTISDLVAEAKANDMFAPAFPDFNSGSGKPAGQGGGQGAKGTNPWKAETRNITEQAKMNKENPVLAAQMKKAAGVG